MAGSDEAISRHLAGLRRGRRGYSKGTVYARERALARMRALIPVPLLEATAGDLAAWLDGLDVIDNTMVHYVSHARAFYRWAVRDGLLERSPADGLDVPVLVRGLPRPVGEEDLMRAHAAAPPRIRPWLVLAGWAGLRAKEIALLRRENVADTARPPVLRVAADATKGRRPRIVPMIGFVAEELRAAGLAPAGYVFRRADGRPGPNTPATVSHQANRFLHELGVDATLHQLRHRFATEAYRLTRDPRRVQEWLGHARLETVSGYVALAQDEGAALLEGLPVPPLLRVAG